MNEKNDLPKEFEIPSSYYIDINGGPYMSLGHFKNNLLGGCHITIYKSLDRGHGGPPVEHLIKIGNFVINNIQNIKGDDFLKEIRQGIEKIIHSENKFPSKF